MNKMTIFLLVALFPSFSYGSFPTVAELCTAGAELFCCRPTSTTGLQIVPLLPLARQKSYTAVIESVHQNIDVAQFTEEKKEAALARYNKIISSGLYDRAQVDAGAIKSSLISQETIQIALAYEKQKNIKNSNKKA